MSERIATPRRSSPRLKIPAGSVGIAGTQTGVYPIETPGGWQIIGRTPLALFRPGEDPPSLLRAGDTVRFKPIETTEDVFHPPPPVARTTEENPRPLAGCDAQSIRVIRPGLLTTIQDFGRRGQQQFGVSVGGAMYAWALRIANLLVGNAEHEAALEITLWGPTLEFEQDTLIAICGGELSPRVEGHDSQVIPTWRPVWIRAHSRLAFGSATCGARAVLAVAGGFDVPTVMGSCSTHLRAGIGGFQGRPVRTGDQLAIRPPSAEAIRLMQRLAENRGEPGTATGSWSARSMALQYAEPATIRVLRGAQFDWLDDDSQRGLFSTEFEVTNQSDRMGFRLAGPKLRLARQSELISEAVCGGTIQLPPEGQPILLMADCATTGGYAKIAHVAAVDLPLIAQVRPGGRIRFVEISVSEAQALFLAREALIARLKIGLDFQAHE